MLHSLVRVSRRVGWDRLGASDLSAHRDCTATPPSRSAGTARSPHRSDAVVAAVRPCGLRCSGEGRHSPQSLPRRAPGASTETRRTRPTAHRAHGAAETAADWSTRECGRERRAVPPATGPRGIPPPVGAHRSACSHRGPSRPHSLPSQRFHALFDSLSKVLFIFPSRYLFAIGLVPVFSLRWSLPPTLGCNPKQPDSPKRPRIPQSVAPAHGAITLSGAPFLGDFGRIAAEMALLQTTIRRCTHRRLQAWAVPASLAATGGILVSFFSSAY